MNDFEMACFLAVARTGSFVAAANEMYTTKQNISQTIHKLETELGFPLLMRDSHSVSVTEAGRLFREHLFELSDLRYKPDARQRQITLRPIVWVGIDDWIKPPNPVARFLNDYERRHGCTFRFVETDSTDAIRMLRDGEVDCALISSYCARRLDRICAIHPVAEVEAGIHIARRHPLSGCRDLKRFAEVPHLTCRAGEDCDEEVIERLKKQTGKLGYEPKEIRILPNLSSVVVEALLCNGLFLVARTPPHKEIVQRLDTNLSVSLVFARRRDTVIPELAQLPALFREKWEESWQ